MDKEISELRKAVEEDPGAPEFVDLAKKLLEEDESRAEAREICFKGLNRDPKNSLGRLALARAFYLDGLTEFAVRELVELQKHVSVKSLDRLLDSFGEYAEPFRVPAAKKPDPTGSAGDSDEVSDSSGSPQDEDDDEEVLAAIDLDDEMMDEALEEIENELDVELDEESGEDSDGEEDEDGFEVVFGDDDDDDDDTKD